MPARASATNERRSGERASGRGSACRRERARPMSGGGEKRAVLAALAANLGIAIAKFIGFALTGAASLLAEAIHSVADTSNQGLLLLGDRRARREPSESHPFGYARE